MLTQVPRGASFSFRKKGRRIPEQGQPGPDRNEKLRQELIELAKQKPRYGYTQEYISAPWSAMVRRGRFGSALLPTGGMEHW